MTGGEGERGSTGEEAVQADSLLRMAGFGLVVWLDCPMHPYYSGLSFPSPVVGGALRDRHAGDPTGGGLAVWVGLHAAVYHRG